MQIKGTALQVGIDKRLYACHKKSYGRRLSKSALVNTKISLAVLLYLLQNSQMAFNEKLADRVRELLAEAGKNIDEKLMFGGLCFMVDNKMCVCVSKDRLMLRLDPDFYEEALEKEGI